MMWRYYVEPLLLKVRLLFFTTRSTLHKFFSMTETSLPRGLYWWQHHFFGWWRQRWHWGPKKLWRWRSATHDCRWSSNWWWHVVVWWLGNSGKHVVVAPVINAWVDESTRRTPRALPLVEKTTNRPRRLGSLACGSGTSTSTLG